MGRAKTVLTMVKEAFADWKDDNAPRLGAALAYYTVFSLAPLLVIAIAIAGLAFGHEAAQGRIVEEIQGLVGKAGAEAVQGMLESARKPSSSIWAAVLGTVTLVLGASGAFTELRGALNIVWEAPPKPGRGIWGAMRDRLLSFAMVLVLGFLLLVSLAVSAGLAAVHGFSVGLWPGAKVLLEVLNAAFSFGVVTVLFAAIFKLLPDTKIDWRDVWAGAATTAALFTVGKTLIGLYLGKSSIASAYGAAASLAIILAWVYYAAQILFFGAELTQVYARRHGSRREIRSASPAVEPAAAGPRLVPRPPAVKPPSRDTHEPTDTLDRASRRAMAVYKAGVAVGVAAGRLLRRRKRGED
jgi:membrane protein